VRPHPVVAMGPDRHHLLKLALACIVKSATLLWASYGAAVLQDLNPQRGSRSPKMLGTASQSVDARPLPERFAFH
jgi:hypothetical protein